MSSGFKESDPQRVIINFAAHNTCRAVKKSFKRLERVLKKIFKKL
jgi:hypothetical protein